MSWTKILLGNYTEDGWSYDWDSTEVADGEKVIYARAFDGVDWSAPASRVINVKNGINETDGDAGKADASDEVDNLLWLVVGSIAIVIIIIGLVMVFLIITRGNKKVKKYVPDGRIEPSELDMLETSLSTEPSPSPGVVVKQVSVPIAATTSSTGGAGYGLYTSADAPQSSISVTPGGYGSAKPAQPTTTQTLYTPTKQP